MEFFLRRAVQKSSPTARCTRSFPVREDDVAFFLFCSAKNRMNAKNAHGTATLRT